MVRSLLLMHWFKNSINPCTGKQFMKLCCHKVRQISPSLEHNKKLGVERRRELNSDSYSCVCCLRDLEWLMGN